MHGGRVKACRVLIWSRLTATSPKRGTSAGAGQGTWQSHELARPATAHGARPWQGDAVGGHRGVRNPAPTQKPLREASERREAGRESMRHDCLCGSQSTRAPASRASVTCDKLCKIPV
eukprot:1696571-Pleurochrysis_carterae.AAC.1